MRQNLSLSDLSPCRTSSPEVLNWFDVMFRQEPTAVKPQCLTEQLAEATPQQNLWNDHKHATPVNRS